MDLYKLSCDVEQYVIDMRREFHKYPEISFQEKRTTARIKEELEKFGVPCVTVGSGNVVGIIDTGRPGKGLAIRADIDPQMVPASRMEFDATGHYARPDVLDLHVLDK